MGQIYDKIDSLSAFEFLIIMFMSAVFSAWVIDIIFKAIEKYYKDE